MAGVPQDPATSMDICTNSKRGHMHQPSSLRRGHLHQVHSGHGKTDESSRQFRQLPTPQLCACVTCAPKDAGQHTHTCQHEHAHQTLTHRQTHTHVYRRDIPHNEMCMALFVIISKIKMYSSCHKDKVVCLCV